ncbi:SDR family NAD(P)-dependent oxidoreductase [Amycolatopsis sp. SID8362]|uniref:SDR family NAD(P)-dependent oxidoreductase n=1 Tax=Amycolatopsis sp. SID8362 TaxID=2690346 RepID=UPI00136A9A38|nr:SDR family NAD(P)-dependent oxidoreductase [Amycolatopsis sp. SID8362]NBH06875.1 SDR family NAD(P)-dependent oxidoreductase [Amycolatopsis sp. SID8362]NED43572.1 SDR family NAD(P)-dependent oxidoreductase [Amycolatopsis sp. SID8362]
MNESKVALVTGASRARGLGFAVARELATRGYHAVLAGRNLEQTRELADQLVAEGLSADAVRLDLTNPADVEACAEHLRATAGRLDALVNNAANMPDFTVTSLLDADIAAARASYDVVVLGTWALTQACLPLLRAAPAARIVNVSSGAAAQIGADVDAVRAPGYALAKYALEGLTTALAAELRGAGIHVEAVDPGSVATHPERGDDADDRSPAEAALDIAAAATGSR